MAAFKDHFSGHAADYRAFRPSYPPELFAFLAAVDSVLARLQDEYVGSFWPPERAFVDAGYHTIPFAFEEIEKPAFEMAADWDLPTLTGYMNTWSAVKRFERANGFNPLDRLAHDLRAAWGDPAAARTVRWRFALRVGRVADDRGTTSRPEHAAVGIRLG